VLRDVLPVVLLTHLFFVGLTLLIPLWRHAIGVSALTVPHATGTPFDAWNRWDVRWYDDLARLGYNLHGPNDYKNVAFFPLYPLLVRTLHDALAIVGRDVLGLAPQDPFYPPYLVPGMIVANLCAVAALSFFYGYVRLDYDRALARRTVTLLALSPLSFYMFAAYSESTFLLCALAFFYALRLKRWRQAGLWGLLAAATRPPGIVLVVPFLMAWAEAHPWEGSDNARRAVLHLLPVVTIPLGLGLFMTYLSYVFGDPLWFSQAQQAWWRTFAPPWETLYISVAWPLGDVLRGTITYWDPVALHDLAYAIVGLGLTWLAWQRLPRVEGVYLGLLWGMILTSPAMLPDRLTHEPHHDVLMSLPRMLLMMFPLFTYLAGHRRPYPWLAVAFTAGLLVYTGRFLTGGWVA
jgi:hypothetical protein